VTNLSREFCSKLRDARRSAGLTQSELAHEVGCKQSALSMFEQGDGTKLNDEVVERLAKKFNVQLPKGESTPPPPRFPLESAGSGFCPNPRCPSNHAYSIDDRRYYRIGRLAADPVGGRHCALCGELLERKCPNCGAPVHDGAICSICGDPYVVG